MYIIRIWLGGSQLRTSLLFSFYKVVFLHSFFFEKKKKAPSFLDTFAAFFLAFSWDESKKSNVFNFWCHFQYQRDKYSSFPSRLVLGVKIGTNGLKLLKCQPYWGRGGLGICQYALILAFYLEIAQLGWSVFKISWPQKVCSLARRYWETNQKFTAVFLFFFKKMSLKHFLFGLCL